MPAAKAGICQNRRDLHVGFYRLSTNVQLGGKCRQFVPRGSMAPTRLEDTKYD